MENKFENMTDEEVKNFQGGMFLEELTDYCDRLEDIEEKEVTERNLAVYKKDLLVITLDDWYEVDLEKITSPEELIDWIWHLSEKDWFTPQHLADFLYRFHQAFGDPRGEPSPWKWPKAPLLLRREHAEEIAKVRQIIEKLLAKHETVTHDMIVNEVVITFPIPTLKKIADECSYNSGNVEKYAFGAKRLVEWTMTESHDLQCSGRVVE